MQTRSKLVRGISLLAAVGLLIAASGTANAQPRWKFKEGQTLNYVIERGVEGKINLSGAEIAFTLGMTFDTTWKPKSTDADGNAVVEQTIDRIQINMSSPLAGEMTFDSNSPEKPEGPVWQQLEPMVTGLLGQTFEVKISPAGRVLDIKLPEKLAENLAKQQAGQNRQMGFGVGGNAFNEKGIKELIAKSVLPLPENKEPNWTQSFENEIPGIGKQTAETTYALGDVEKQDGKNVQKITAKTELIFEPAENPRADLEITEQDAEATYLFDTDAGQLLEGKGIQTAKLELSGPQELTQDIKETMTIRQGKSPEKSQAKPAAEATK